MAKERHLFIDGQSKDNFMEEFDKKIKCSLWL